ncbi:MAG: cytochrome P450 [Rhodobacter sp.]|uniref:cytochrome P450 n=1 Tax=Pararhodobacter sp. TaxID=2127056 RepID=UPI001D5A1F94|nr:cytochrome P450 [Pararhodobacter sp.]MCB1345363.1 cytochrome P450 [Paracoccaceae bacterium]MCC0072625.1 cytochrome P450 [Rhodobacter sp.]HPD92700.1 cytochrome P450 [Pararhodobacter sp.]
MSDAPVFEIDPAAFWADPYPTLKAMRAAGPVLFVPQLGATLLTRRDDVFENEKKIEIFSSDQPGGLMTQLMGQNMMRKDGAAHQAERAAIFPTVSPRTVKTVWRNAFEGFTAAILDDLRPVRRADMVRDIAMRISGEALKVITGLTQIGWDEMDRVSQGMIDGCANYAGDPAVTARCNDCTAAIDRYIDARVPALLAAPDHSLLSVQLQAGLTEAQYRANVKLAISGGQNEPRDVIAGLTWAMLTHPDQRALVTEGTKTWLDAFEEYARWIAPVGMSPRRVAQRHVLHGVTLEPEDRVFLMFGSANRDEAVFARPDHFDLTQDCGPAVSFGAGPHFCAGAWAARSLIADVAMPMIFDRLPGLRLDGETRFGGWAFRGPLVMPVAWD